MATPSDYDGSLTSRIREELDHAGDPSDPEQGQLKQLVERLEGEFQNLISEPSRRDRTFAFLRSREIPGRGGTRTDPLRGALNEIAELSSRLDAASDPTEGFAVAERVADRAHEIGHTVEGFLGALNPVDAITAGFHRLAALVSQLIRNAVNKLQQFAKLLHVSSFSVTFATTPPQVSVTFTFGGA